MSLTAKLNAAAGRLFQEFAKFGLIGILGVFVSLAVFNLARVGLTMSPVRSSIVATVVAMVFTYLGNRFWTYRDRERIAPHRELVFFIVSNIIGMGIQSGILAVTHYGLGLTSLAADNVSYNILGLGLATVFRFWAYRTWVFPDTTPAVAEPTAQDLADLDAGLESILRRERVAA